MKPIQRWVAVGLVSLLGWWPVAGLAGQGSEQPPEQRVLLSKTQIEQVQKRLQAEGYDPGPLDGTMNAQTEAALRAYQQREGLGVSGALDGATLKQLQLEFPTSTPGQ